MMSKMSPEDMKKMKEMASNMGLPSYSGPSGAAAGPSTSLANSPSSLHSHSNALSSIPAALTPDMAKMVGFGFPVYECEE
jgi:hypothetical protein